MYRNVSLILTKQAPSMPDLETFVDLRHVRG